MKPYTFLKYLICTNIFGESDREIICGIQKLPFYMDLKNCKVCQDTVKTYAKEVYSYV